MPGEHHRAQQWFEKLAVRQLMGRLADCHEPYADHLERRCRRAIRLWAISHVAELFAFGLNRTAGLLRDKTREEGTMGEPVDLIRTQSAEARERLQALIRGYRMSQAVYVATRLGIPDILADGPRDVEELAQKTGSDPPSLRRVLAALASVGVLDKIGPRHFALTEMGFGLRTGVPGSARPAVLFLLNEAHWRPWGHLLHTVRTGQTAFEHATRSEPLEFLSEHPEEADLFNKGMAGNSPPTRILSRRRMISRRLASSSMSRADADGCSPRSSRATRFLRGTLFDLPHVLVEDARQLINACGCGRPLRLRWWQLL